MKEIDSNPLVTVIIPSYNMGKYISDAIISCLNQTYKKLEVIVVDDGSIDDTNRIVSMFKPVVSYYYQNNSGVSAARNLGIKHSKGRYISFLDADDIWLPQKIDIQIAAIKKNPMIKAISCGYAIMNETGKITTDGISRGNFNNREEQHRALSICQLVPGSSSGMLVEKECFTKTGLFDEAVYIGEDWDMWLRISNFNQIHFLEEVLAILRIRQEKDAIRSIENERSQVERIISKRINRSCQKKAYSALYARIGSHYLIHKNYNLAIRFLLKSILKYPFPIFPVDFKNRYRYPRRQRVYLLAKTIIQKFW